MSANAKRKSYVFDPFDDPEEQIYEYMGLADEIGGPFARQSDRIAPAQAKGVYFVPQGRRTIVYRAFTVFDTLLYVGVTRELCTRMASHKRGSPWWCQVHHIEWELFGSRRAALTEESRLIEELRPPFNTVGMPRGEGYRKWSA